MSCGCWWERPTRYPRPSSLHNRARSQLRSAGSNRSGDRVRPAPRRKVRTRRPGSVGRGPMKAPGAGTSGAGDARSFLTALAPVAVPVAVSIALYGFAGAVEDETHNREIGEQL